MVTQWARSYGERSPRQVCVYTIDRIYAGITHLCKGERLIDCLNDANERDRSFLPLLDLRVRGWAPESPESALSFAVVNVHQILLAWEPGGTPQLRPDIVPKRLVAVRLELEGHLVVKGSVHCAPAESVLNVLNRRERFVPLTDARLGQAIREDEVWLPSAAVNKEYVVSAREV